MSTPKNLSIIDKYKMLTPFLIPVESLRFVGQRNKIIVIASSGLVRI